MYSAKKNNVLVKLDFSTFEVRGLAARSNDKMMLKLFKKMNKIRTEYRNNTTTKTLEEVKNLTDFHKWSASLFFQKKIEDITKKVRQEAKSSLVFGCIYGRTDNSLAGSLGITIEKAKLLRSKFKGVMPGASIWMEETKKSGKENLFIESSLGRRRRLWGYLQFFNKFVIAKMDRLAVNADIQGLCSDLNIIGTSLLIEHIYKCNKAIYQVNWDDAWKVINNIHDSCEQEIPLTMLKKATKIAEKIFTKKLVTYVRENFGFSFNVPIEVDIDLGLSLDKMKPWDGRDSHLIELIKEIKLQGVKNEK